MWYTHAMNISRRNFLTGIGGLVAVSQLPSLAGGNYGFADQEILFV